MSPAASTATAPFWARLSSFGDAPALVTAEGELSYAALAARVDELAHRLGTTRRLVLAEGVNTVDVVVTYLAALKAGHPLLLVPDAEAVASYDADVVVRGESVVERRRGTAHDLHPDLALLLSTSGSTGSPKLVRLSHENLTSNAAAIASYLQIRRADVAPTTLPISYCYGLSILNSHLSAGAAVLLTDESVTSAGFWDAFRASGCTTLAGVPYTFDLLDRVGFESMDLPSLRYVTQAGGRLDPEVVRRYAALGQAKGFDLFVMYGQTEATARMAYLPPDLAATCPEAVGVPVPGGSFDVTDEGELVYRGDNVMLGYAESPADLARGREVDALHTGDLARRRPDGLYEITGRCSRFAKVYGLRIDLARVEQTLAASGIQVHCADGGDRVVVAIDVSASPAPAGLLALAADAAGLPEAAIQVLRLAQVPRLATGKPDYRAMVAAAAAGSPGQPGERVASGSLPALFAAVLRRDDVTLDDSFVSLGGDSLSYVEMSIKLEEAVGALPADWHLTPIGELAAVRPRRQRGRLVEMNVLLRALAIVLIVGSHTDLFTLMGGAHVLLGVAGYNFGRFFLTSVGRSERVRRLGGAVVRIAVPAMLWCALAMTWDSEVTWRNALLVNGLVGPEQWDDSWHYWFVEAIVYILLALMALVALPWFDRLERAWPFWLPIAIAAVALLTRYDVLVFRSHDMHRANVVFWLFALGWATAKATRWQHRALVSVVVVATVPGLFTQPERTWIVVGGMLLLVWVRAVRVPGFLAAPIGLLASASFYIYLCHWQLYPAIEAAGHSLLAMLVSLAAGSMLWWFATRRLSFGEIRENLRWLNLRRYATSDSWTQRAGTQRRPAARPCGDDQPAHLPA